MDRAKINKININRLTGWKDRLNENHSTPVLLFGVGHDHKKGECLILVTEDTTNFELLAFAKEAVRMLEAQISQVG